jgi:hypothetical protein
VMNCEFEIVSWELLIGDRKLLIVSWEDIVKFAVLTTLTTNSPQANQQFPTNNSQSTTNNPQNPCPTQRFQFRSRPCNRQLSTP